MSRLSLITVKSILAMRPILKLLEWILNFWRCSSCRLLTLTKKKLLKYLRSGLIGALKSRTAITNMLRKRNLSQMTVQVRVWTCRRWKFMVKCRGPRWVWTMGLQLKCVLFSAKISSVSRESCKIRSTNQNSACSSKWFRRSRWAG